MSDKITKEEFDKEVESYKETPLYQKKGDAYKNGFADALFLAWQIVDEYEAEEEEAMSITITPCCGNNEECFESGHEQWGHLGKTMCKFLQDSGDELAFMCPKTDKPIYKNEIY